MYNEHDRPSVTRMAVTAAVAVAGVAALIALASVVFGMTIGRPQSPAAPRPVASVQSPATATAEIPAAEPAPAAPSSTAAIAAPPAAVSAKPSSPASAKSAPAPAPVVNGAGLGPVVIDAGHEGSPPPGSEPIGPGSSVMKVKLESGATGVATHVEESQRNLDVALRLQKALEARGVKVIMVRTSQDVKISNKQRAEIANNADAKLFIRLHCDSSTSPSTRGVLTLEPGKNWYPDHPIVAQSAVAAKIIHSATLAATGAYDRGITSRTDLTGFNWSKVPSVLVEMGLLSNPTEDRKLATAAYQNELASGMADGIVAYLKR